MIYKGLFKDASDVIHTITITTPVGSGTLEITLCASPFTEEMDADDDVFKPIKYTSATVRVLVEGVDNYMFDVYLSDMHSVEVRLEANNKVEWIGYVTPNLYTLGYDYDKEDVEIECIDALSILQYAKYTPCDDVKKVKSFKLIVDHIIRDYTPYKISLEIPPIYEVNGEIAKLSNYTISEENFFGDEEDDTWTCLEVLEEIFSYLNLTAIAQGIEVKLLHYPSVVTNRTNTYVIDSDSYCENGNRISLDKTFNKVSVVSKINPIKHIVPDIFAEKYLTNWNGDWRDTMTYYFDKKDGLPQLAGASLFNSWEARYRFFKSPNYKTTYYDKNNKVLVAPPERMTYLFLQNNIGATLMQCNFQQVDRNPVYPYQSLAELSYTYYLLIHQHDVMAKLPVFTTQINTLPEVYLGSAARIILSGSISVWDRQGNMTKCPLDYGEKKDDFGPSNLYLEAQLKWGDYYYTNYSINGSSVTVTYPGRWTTTPSTFRIFFDVLDSKHLNGKEFQIVNTNGFYGNEGISAGYIIKIPDEVSVVASAPQLTLYTRSSRIANEYRVDCMWLKDFNIKVDVAKDQKVKDEDWDSDTEYTNVINESYVNEGDARECKITTWDNKKPTYSVVVYKPNSGNSFYLDTVKCLKTNLTLRHEEHIIYSLVTLYKSPAKILELNLKDRLSCDTRLVEGGAFYVINGYSKDYELCTNNYTLVQWNS